MFLCELPPHVIAIHVGDADCEKREQNAGAVHLFQIGETLDWTKVAALLVLVVIIERPRTAQKFELANGDVLSRGRNVPQHESQKTRHRRPPNTTPALTRTARPSPDFSRNLLSKLSSRAE